MTTTEITTEDINEEFTTYTLHEYLHQLQLYLCQVEIPYNTITYYNIYDAKTILHLIDHYLCEMDITNNNEIGVKLPDTSKEIIQQITRYLDDIQLENDNHYEDVDFPKPLHKVLAVITDYILHIPVEKRCIIDKHIVGLHEGLSRITDYICKVPTYDGCYSNKSIDTLPNVLQDIIDYLCVIDLEYNCIASPNPGNVVEILNAIGRYICEIPVCPNCAIFDSHVELHEAIRQISDYICNLKGNSPVISESELHGVVKEFGKYLSEICIEQNQTGLENAKYDLYTILEHIVNYLCDIDGDHVHSILGLETSTSVPDLSAWQLSLTSLSSVDVKTKLPLFHFYIDVNDIINPVSIELDYNKIIDMISSEIYLTQTQRSRLVGYIYVETKSFIIPCNTINDHNDNRLYADVQPDDEWFNKEISYIPDTGDCHYIHHNVNHGVYIDQNTNQTITLSPSGVLYMKYDNPLTDAVKWSNDSNISFYDTYNQRNRNSYRVHIIIGNQNRLIFA